MTSSAGSAATDLGRRIAEESDRARLSIKEAAERAAMSPEYLACMEASDGIEPWAGADRNTYVRVTPATVAGRQLRIVGR